MPPVTCAHGAVVHSRIGDAVNVGNATKLKGHGLVSRSERSRGAVATLALHPLLALVAAIAMLLGAEALARAQPSSYEATAIVTFTPRQAAVGADIIRTILPRYTAVATSDQSLDTLARRIGAPVGSLNGHISATVQPGTANLLTQATDRDANRAVVLANGVAAIVLVSSTDNPFVTGQLIVPAVTGKDASGRKRLGIRVAGLVAAGFVALFVAWLRERLRRRVRKEQHLRQLTSLQVGGTVTTRSVNGAVSASGRGIAAAAAAIGLHVLPQANAASRVGRVIVCSINELLDDASSVATALRRVLQPSQVPVVDWADSVGGAEQPLVDVAAGPPVTTGLALVRMHDADGVVALVPAGCRKQEAAAILDWLGDSGLRVLTVLLVQGAGVSPPGAQRDRFVTQLDSRDSVGGR
jgi:capsular polysaccharide biosynthesis protein